MSLDAVIGQKVLGKEKKKRNQHNLVFTDAQIEIPELDEVISLNNEGWEAVTDVFNSNAPSVVVRKLVILCRLLQEGKVKVIRTK